jgi:phosphoribosylformylglycinamidine synthase
MIFIFKKNNSTFYTVQALNPLSEVDTEKLIWLLGNAEKIDSLEVKGEFVGPRREMVTPWSTNAVEITQNMGIKGIQRIEEFTTAADFDPMLMHQYNALDQDIFTIDKTPDEILEIDNISAYNQQEGLALSAEEIEYLEKVSEDLGRKLTDSEVFGFSQVNSEHCRHKIFNGTFIIDGQEKPESLFKLIKKTSKENWGLIESAYKDNVAFIKGPKMEQFAPTTQDKPDYFETRDIDSVLSLKAETHNFPTTVEPFNGAATGSGGEIRDRMAGGQGSIPLAGTAVYMTSYSRLEKGKKWEEKVKERDWLYQTPLEILIKASNGASDFGNKFGQPLICGSLLTFEHEEGGKTQGFDKVIMQAGGVGYGKLEDAQKKEVTKGDKIVILGGDNYRIGMGGGAVSSVATGEFTNSIELNAVQRSNPEMQKRVMNTIRALSESAENPIISVHDHGAGGHLNCLSELVEETGGNIDINKLPVGDPTLSDKEIIGNESQERMGLAIKEKDIPLLEKIAARERSPIYTVGEATGDQKFVLSRDGSAKSAINWGLSHMFGSAPKTILVDSTISSNYNEPEYDVNQLQDYLDAVLQLEGVACKDWLTNKVDRSVTGRVAKQQTCGEIQLPLNNVAVMALDFVSNKGIATSLGHAPIAALASPAKGSKLAIAKSLTNLIWAPLTHGLNGVSLSANWMWPTKTDGEKARLYEAVEAISQFAIDLGINVPTGKDSMSMSQKYSNGQTVDSPGTVIISAIGETSDITKVISPNIKPLIGSKILYIPLSDEQFELGGSSFAQSMNTIGNTPPNLKDADSIKSIFSTIQELILDNKILAGHDVAAGGLITSLLEMNFPNIALGMTLDLEEFQETDLIKILFCENPALIIQIDELSVIETLEETNVAFTDIGMVSKEREITIQQGKTYISLDINKYRDSWYKTSFLLDQVQTSNGKAQDRFDNYKNQPMQFQFPENWNGNLKDLGIDNKRKNPSGVKAAIIREKGVNGDREMAYALHLAGFDVKDVHMTDLISGREDLSNVNMIVFVGGFSNSDVLGSAKGWAGAFLYNEKAKLALDNFYKRKDTLSLGVCNGCQLMMELGLIFPEMKDHPKMQHNDSHKFESTFVDVTIPKNDSIMFRSLSETRMGVWLAHGEGKFDLPGDESGYNIGCKFSYSEYPGNPNGSDFNTAAVYSNDGRHFAIMPHLERTIFPWNWAYYPENKEEVSPWILPFISAKEWIIKNNQA